MAILPVAVQKKLKQADISFCKMKNKITMNKADLLCLLKFLLYRIPFPFSRHLMTRDLPKLPVTHNYGSLCPEPI